LFKWFKKQRDITKKVAGLYEKTAATKKKIEVAMSILNKREKNIPISFERRIKDEFEDFKKLKFNENNA